MPLSISVLATSRMKKLAVTFLKHSMHLSYLFKISSDTHPHFLDLMTAYGNHFKVKPPSRLTNTACFKVNKCTILYNNACTLHTDAIASLQAGGQNTCRV